MTDKVDWKQAGELIGSLLRDYFAHLNDRVAEEVKAYEGERTIAHRTSQSPH